MVTTESAIMFAFMLSNTARVLAYLPQIIAIARDEGRANAVSGSTWSLFFVANLTSALYAGVLSGDTTMMIAFAANTACCAAIVATLCWKRRAVRCVLDLLRR